MKKKPPHPDNTPDYGAFGNFEELKSQRDARGVVPSSASRIAKALAKTQTTTTPELFATPTTREGFDQLYAELGKEGADGRTLVAELAATYASMQLDARPSPEDMKPLIPMIRPLMEKLKILREQTGRISSDTESTLTPTDTRLSDAEREFVRLHHAMTRIMKTMASIAPDPSTPDNWKDRLSTNEDVPNKHNKR